MENNRESYDPRYFEPLFAAEERHFWFVARNKVISAMVQKALAGRMEDVHLLEVGCGTGNVLRVLVQEFPEAVLLGMDLFHEGLRLAQKRVKCPLVQADLAFPPFSKLFDLVGLFDVLEHIKEDQSVLDQLCRVVKPGGSLLITVPADPRLWSYFDVASHHVRRYTLEGLISKVQSAGFEIEFASPYIAATYPIVWLNRRINGDAGNGEDASVHRKAEEELRIIPVVNFLFRVILGMEADWLARGNHLPYGSSLVLLARKPSISR
ncbi:MAG: class I SAM-dependent methyltransferase [Leptolinea sp.]